MVGLPTCQQLRCKSIELDLLTLQNVAQGEKAGCGKSGNRYCRVNSLLFVAMKRAYSKHMTDEWQRDRLIDNYIAANIYKQRHRKHLRPCRAQQQTFNWRHMIHHTKPLHWTKIDNDIYSSTTSVIVAAATDTLTSCPSLLLPALLRSCGKGV